MRLPFIVQVDLTWDEGRASAYSTDLSVTGLFVRTEIPVQLGTEVKLEFVVFSQAGKLPVVVVGDVARLVTSEESAMTGEVAGMGVRFRQLEQGEKELFQFLGQRLEALQGPLPELPGTEVPLPNPADEGIRAHWGSRPELDNTAMLFDIDRKGSFFLETPAPVAIGDHVYLWFSLPLTPKAMPVKATATVSHLGTDGDKHRGMVVRVELSTLDIHIIETFFSLRNRPPGVGRGQPAKNDDKFYRSLGLPPPKKRKTERTLLDATAEMIGSSDERPSRTVWLAGGAILLILLFLWLVVF